MFGKLGRIEAIDKHFSRFGVKTHPGRKSPDRTFVVVHREPDLLAVIGTLHAPSGFASSLHSRQQQPDQDPDDRDDHQQFHQGECWTNDIALFFRGRETPHSLAKWIDCELPDSRDCHCVRKVDASGIEEQ